MPSYAAKLLLGPFYYLFFYTQVRSTLRPIKVVSKSRTSSYSTLLSELNVERLSTRQSKWKLLTTFKIKNDLLHYPPPPPITPWEPSHTYNLRANNHHNIKPICSNLQVHRNSFFPSSINLWNTALPDQAKSTLSISQFKFYLDHLIHPIQSVLS